MTDSEKGSLHRQLLHHTDDTKQEVFAATNEAYAMTAVCFGVILIAASSFFYLRNSPALKKRQPDLVLWSVVHTCLLYTAVCMNLCFAQDKRWQVYKRHRDIFPLVFWAVGFNTSMANWITVYRFHFIWWDLGTAAALEDMDWRLLIDDQAEQKSFYLKYRSKFGNKMMVGIYCLIWITLTPMAGAISLAMNDNIPSRSTRMWIGIQSWLPMIHLFIVYLFLPKYNDLFHFRTETIMVSVLSICYGTTHYFWAFETKPHPNTVEYAWWLTFTFPFICLRILFQTTMVQWLNDLPLTPWAAEMMHRKKLRGYLYDAMNVNLSTILSRTGSSEENTLTDGQLKLSVADPCSMTGSPRRVTSQVSQRERAGTMNAAKPLLDLLADDAGLRLLCRHLFREFSSENILFLIETEQLITLLKQEHEFELGPEIMPLSLEFAKTTPKSRIVLKSPELNEWGKAVHIFDKYLRSNDQITELNLSYFIRQASYAVFGYSREGYAKVGVTDVNQVTFDLNQASQWLSERMDITQLLHVFDEPRKEAFNLVRESWTRMSRSKGYLDWAGRNAGTEMVSTPRANSIASDSGLSAVSTPRSIV